MSIEYGTSTQVIKIMRSSARGKILTIDEGHLDLDDFLVAIGEVPQLSSLVMSNHLSIGM